jgi:hypothetical protein
MPLSDVIEKLGRAIFEAPFSGARITEDAPELAEIRLAVLDAVKSRSHRVGEARVFSYDMVRIHLRGIPEEQAGIFQSSVLADHLAQDLRAAFARSSYRFPANLHVEFRTTAQLPGPDEEWFWIDTEITAAPPPDSSRHRRGARLVVVQGVANEQELFLRKARTNIGRTVDVFRSEGPSRRNDLAFTEDTDVNRSVSREHAHIVVDRKSGEYRLHNDRWYKAGAVGTNSGVWIVRDGLSQPVHRGDRGVALKPGDEIHLGQAVVKFLMR